MIGLSSSGVYQSLERLLACSKYRFETRKRVEKSCGVVIPDCGDTAYCSGHNWGALAADSSGSLLVRLQADPHGSYSYVASQVLNGSCLRRLEAYIE